MRVLRALGGSLLWILSGLIGLVGVLLSITIILLPIGIPLLWLARKLFRAAMVMLVPKKARHPVEAAADSVRDRAGDASSSLSSAASSAVDRGRSFIKDQRKRFA